VLGLLALLLLQDSRRAARATAEGELILLADQDRSRWDRARIAEGTALLRRAISSGETGPYGLQAAIAAAHAEAPTAEATDWDRIVGLYDLLARADPSPVIELNRAVAVAMRDGPAAGLARIDPLLAGGRLDTLHLARQRPERRFLERRLRELE
jgi:RNA polymerase sigma-70 factor (ECF subfamily)